MNVPTCTVPGCDRPCPDRAHACQPCGDALAQSLGDVAWLADELATTETRQTRSGDRNGPRGATRPLPWDDRAARALAGLQNTLATWARVVLEERGPGAEGLPRGGQPVHVARWLLHHVQWLRHHPAAAEAVEDVTNAVRRAKRAVDRPADRWYAGPCGNTDGRDEPCPGEVYAKPGAPTVRCRVCGAVWDVTERRAWLLAAAEDVLAHAELIARAVAVLGEPITPSMIRGYVARRRIIAKGVDATGRELYRVGDVLDVAAQAAASPRSHRRPAAEQSRSA